MSSNSPVPDCDGQEMVEHRGANHLLIKEGSKFSYFLIPSSLTSENEESNLCFTDHGTANCDPRVQQCCLREDGHVHAHVHRNDNSIEDILLEQCVDELGCKLPLLWDLSTSCLDGVHEGEKHSHDGYQMDNHVHKEGCGHEQITHGDHSDWLVPMNDGSYMLSHDDGASQHGRLVKIGESKGKLRKHSEHFFDLFKYEGPCTADCNDGGSTTARNLFSNTSVGSQPGLCGSCCSKGHEADAVQSLLEESAIIDMGSETQLVELHKTMIDVLGICCPAEVPLIKRVLEPIPGVREVAVNVASKLVTVHHDPVAVSPAKLVQLLNGAQLDASIHIRGKFKAAHKWPSPYTIASGIFLVIAMFHYLFGPLKWVALGAVAVGLPPIVMKSFISLRRVVLDINILMLIAVAGAIGLGDYVEAGFIVFLFTLADWLESRSTDKARLALSSVASLAPQNAVLADTGLYVPVAEVQIGTRLSVKVGESIPIDGLVVSGRSSVDESSLTGESFPVEKEIGGSVWAGTINLTGYLCIETIALAEDSAVARMVRLVEEAQTQRSNMDQLVETFAKYYTPTVVLTAFAIAIVPLIIHTHQERHWLYLALVLLVVACPCALVISTPVTTTCAIAQAARTGLIVKGGKFLEVLGKIKVVAMDKTGTLTEGCFQVVEVHVLDENADMQKLLHWISSIESKASHPIASAIVEYAKLHGAEPNGLVDEFRTLVGEGISGIVDGHEVAIGNDRLANRLHWREGGYSESPLIENWKSQGLTICWVGVDGKLVLTLSAGDQVRHEAAEAVREMKNLGLHMAMLTGDSVATANSVNRKLGEIEVHARLFPEDKVEVIQKLKKIGLTGMVGDGINDAPALAAADVGIAMGVAGTAIAMETADIALMKNDLRKLVTAVKLGRKARRKILQNVFISFATKILVIVLAVVGYTSLWGAVLADVGTCLLVIFNSMLILEKNKHESCLGFLHRHKHTHNGCQKGSKRCTKGATCSKASCKVGSLATIDDCQTESCCTASSCCEMGDKSHNHGIRRRSNHKDTCAKDCEGNDCASVVISVSESASSLPDVTDQHGSACLKKKSLMGGMVSKKGNNSCCQPDTDCCMDSNLCSPKNYHNPQEPTNQSVGRCCGNSTVAQYNHKEHVHIEGSRGCSDHHQAHCCSSARKGDVQNYLNPREPTNQSFSRCCGTVAQNNHQDHVHIEDPRGCNDNQQLDGCSSARKGSHEDGNTQNCVCSEESFCNFTGSKNCCRSSSAIEKSQPQDLPQCCKNVGPATCCSAKSKDPCCTDTCNGTATVCVGTSKEHGNASQIIHLPGACCGMHCQGNI